MRKLPKYIKSICFVVFIISILYSCNTKKKTDWSLSYVNTHKKPFGTYILYQEIDQLFHKKDKILLSKNPYDYFEEKYNYNDNKYSLTGNYVCIDRYMFTLDKEATNEILNFVSHGNTAFIAANVFSKTFKDSLGFKIGNETTLLKNTNNLQMSY